MDQVEIGLFNDPEGHTVGVVKELQQGSWMRAQAPPLG
jgi:hypothetical protein